MAPHCICTSSARAEVLKDVEIINLVSEVEDPEEDPNAVPLKSVGLGSISIFLGFRANFKGKLETCKR